MGTPYLRRGITLADRAVTTTGADYVTAALRYNDYLEADWVHRTGSTAFTGSYYHTVTLTYGYAVSKPMSYDQPARVTEHSSGYRTSTVQRYPRQSISMSFSTASEAEAKHYERFFLLCRGADQIVEFIDEADKAMPVRIDSFSINKNDQSDVARPYTISLSLSCELATSALLQSGSVGTI